jgi:hypothetical protein
MQAEYAETRVVVAGAEVGLANVDSAAKAHAADATIVRVVKRVIDTPVVAT